jgi:hypothetical protein
MKSWAQYIRHVILLTLVLFIAACIPKERAISKTEMPENLMEDIRAFAAANPSNRILQAKQLEESFQGFFKTCELHKCYLPQDVVIELLSNDSSKDFYVEDNIDCIDCLVYKKTNSNVRCEIINFRFRKGKLFGVTRLQGQP